MVVLWRYFWWFLHFGGVPWGHGWVTHPRRLRMGWEDAEKMICVRIWKVFNWIFITWKLAQETGWFLWNFEWFLLIPTELPALPESKQEFAPNFLLPEVVFHLRRQSRNWPDVGIWNFYLLFKKPRWLLASCIREPMSKKKF